MWNKRKEKQFLRVQKFKRKYFGIEWVELSLCVLPRCTYRKVLLALNTLRVKLHVPSFSPSQKQQKNWNAGLKRKWRRKAAALFSFATPKTSSSFLVHFIGHTKSKLSRNDSGFQSATNCDTSRVPGMAWKKNATSGWKMNRIFGKGLIFWSERPPEGVNWDSDLFSRNSWKESTTIKSCLISNKAS